MCKEACERPKSVKRLTQEHIDFAFVILSVATNLPISANDERIKFPDESETSKLKLNLQLESNVKAFEMIKNPQIVSPLFNRHPRGVPSQAPSPALGGC